MRWCWLVKGALLAVGCRTEFDHCLSKVTTHSLPINKIRKPQENKYSVTHCLLVIDNFNDSSWKEIHSITHFLLVTRCKFLDESQQCHLLAVDHWMMGYYSFAKSQWNSQTVCHGMTFLDRKMHNVTHKLWVGSI